MQFKARQIADGSVNNSEFQALNGVSSSIQTQIDGKITSPESPVDGDILYRASGAWSRLPKGTDGQFLTLTSGVPAWANGGGMGLEYVTTITGSFGGSTSTVGTTVSLSAGNYLLRFGVVAGPNHNMQVGYRVNSGSDVLTFQNNGQQISLYSIQVTVAASDTISLRANNNFGANTSKASMEVYKVTA